MTTRWIRWSLPFFGCLAVAFFSLSWWFLHATPGQYRDVFNLVYRHPMGAFNRQPNQLLMDTVASITPGRALDVAMGQGRNAVYLSTKGWDVTGFDVSDEALRQADVRATEAGVRIRTVRESSEAFDYGREQWDLIVFSYAFAPIRDPAYIRRIHDSLKPGGMVVFEHYIGVPGVQSAIGTVPPAELPRLFADFKILRHDETTAKSDWQFGRRARIARLVAIKRGD
ncbi:MAG: class I SAM-dependent methyltransferase [Acidobacteriales bacterium]|nr:class I SAM-dependent methyltransferase [Terriglobales bacterium]